MSNIQKRPEKAVKQKPEEEYSGPKVGDTILMGHEDFHEVIKVNHKKKEITTKNKWDSNNTISFEKFAEDGIILDKPIEEYKRELLTNLETDFAVYDEKESTSTEVTLASGKEQAVSAQRILQQANNKLAIMSAIMERERRHLMNIKSEMLKKLEQISRVVDIIEIYLGIHEEIVQIQEGEPAPFDTPLSIRQLVLHMDEEVADTQEQGLDYTKIDKFDRWLDKHIDQVLPEKKGIVVLRPRRTDKDYYLEKGDDSMFMHMANQEANKANKFTYILIRNGGNVYRIYTGNLRIYPKLFPSAEDMKKLQSDDREFTAGGYDRLDREEKDAVILGYKRNVLMLQGLLDRTQVLRPVPEGLNLLNPQTYGNFVKFIYDADNVIGDGRPSFEDWLLEINSKLKVGDRLYFAGFPWGTFSSKERYDSEEARRFPIKGWTHRPDAGVYNIVRITKDSTYSFKGEVDAFVCHHRPGDKVWKKATYWERGSEHDRKRSIPFHLFADDNFVINYELIDQEAIEYYLKDRLHRHGYLKMMPTLRGLKKMLAEEAVWEEGFVKLMRDTTGASEELIREAIQWWKTKVIQKRPLRKEDAKAVRMIQGFLKRNKT